KEVFFSVRPIVLSLTRPMYSSRRNVHRARPLGGCEQASAVSLASAAPSKMRGLAEAGERFGVSTASNPSSTSCRRTRATVTRPVLRRVGLRHGQFADAAVATIRLKL